MKMKEVLPLGNSELVNSELIHGHVSGIGFCTKCYENTEKEDMTHMELQNSFFYLLLSLNKFIH